MTISTTARRLALAGAGVLAAGTLAAAPAAHAAPVFTSFDVDGYAFAHNHGGDCTNNEVRTPNADDVPVVENGSAVTYAGAATSTLQNNAVPADSSTTSITGTVSTKVTSVGGNLGSIDMSVSGSGSVDTALATTECEVHAGVGGYAEFEFVVAQAGWLTIASQGPSASYSQFELDPTSSGGSEETYTYQFKHKATKTIFLAAGTYTGNIETDLDVLTVSDRTFAGQTSVKATFAVAGSQTVAPTGSGATYVSLGARSCATDTVAAAVTPKGKRADKINKVSFLVNGKRVLKDGNPKKGEAYNVPVADDADAEVTAVVKLKKPKPGKPAKTKEVTSSYVACS